MRALVIGLGSIGTRHLNNLHRLGVKELLAFRKRKLPPPQNLLSQEVKVFQDLEEALLQKPDLAVVANPSHLHFECAIAALRKGVPLYLEKPVTDRLEDARALEKVAAEKKVPVLVGCQLRFHPNLLAVKQWLVEGKLGEVYTAFADVGEYLPGWHPWEDYRDSYAARAEMGGGVVKTLIHELDYAYWLFGSVQDVYAMGGHRTKLEVTAEDTALISLQHHSGVALQMRMDYWRRPATRTLHIAGELGQIRWDYHQGLATLLNHEGQVVEKSELPPQWERNDLFLASMRNALAMVEKSEKPRVPLAEGVIALQMADAALQSMKKREVVHL